MIVTLRIFIYDQCKHFCVIDSTVPEHVVRQAMLQNGERDDLCPACAAAEVREGGK